MLDKQLQELPQETKKRIRIDAAHWNENQYGNDDVNDDYLEGALHEAKIAQSAAQRIEQLEKALNQITKVGWSLGVQGCINVANNALNPKSAADEQA